MPTVTLRFPSNIPGGPGHHWANAIAMATPIAHKGATAGAKVMVMTALDLYQSPELVSKAWEYFKTVQTKDHQYTPFITENDPPPIFLNKERMESFRGEMRKYYYDETKYDTYLEQLGITYPTVREETKSRALSSARCFSPERLEIELYGFERLHSHRRFASVNGGDHPFAALKPKHLEGAGVRVEEPQVGHTLPGIDLELESAVDALGRG